MQESLPLSSSSAAPPTAGQRTVFSLLLVSGLQFFTAIGVFAFTPEETAARVRNLILLQSFGLGISFAVLSLVGKYRPLTATVLALTIFVLGTVALGLVVPSTLARGFIIKLVSLIILLRSTLTALEDRARRA